MDFAGKKLVSVDVSDPIPPAALEESLYYIDWSGNAHAIVGFRTMRMLDEGAFRASIRYEGCSISTIFGEITFDLCRWMPEGMILLIPAEEYAEWKERQREEGERASARAKQLFIMETINGVRREMSATSEE